MIIISHRQHILALQLRQPAWRQTVFVKEVPPYESLMMLALQFLLEVPPLLELEDAGASSSYFNAIAVDPRQLAQCSTLHVRANPSKN
jgi:hypothetical protein